MIEDIQRRLENDLFRPFVVVTNAGGKYRVASRKHLGIGPRKTRMMIWLDVGGSVPVDVANIVAIEDEVEAVRPKSFHYV